MKKEPSKALSIEPTINGIEDAVVTAAKQYLQLLDLDQAPSIDQFCAQHPDIAIPLRPALEGMAMVHRKEIVSPGIDNDTLGAPSGSKDKEILGKPIGDFQIVGELGRGGMGVVYEAIQLSLNRRVALKVLPFASGLDKVRLQRFRNEAHAAAGLHHTNIVPVFAVGSERGVHYYAMQLIEGHTLVDLIERMRSDQSVSTPGKIENVPSSRKINNASDWKFYSGSARKLDETFRQASSTLLKNSPAQNHYFESVVAMVVQAAGALEHAHQYGVIHRDIKPGNLLLDQAGKIWVTDFGLAQIQHADWQLTRSGDHIGTLRYMSPEQAIGDRDLLDHRCDIYSLGITLYELLTLKPAIDGENYRQILNQVAEHEPITPHSVNTAIPVDLDTIVRKAIAKEPSLRYPTAQALADDLQRWLDNKPIAARPPSIWQRAAKWRRRNSLLVNIAGILLALISIGLLATTLVVLQQQNATRQALANEIQQRTIAEQNFQQARKAVDTFSELSESELAFRPEVQTLRRKILETSLEFYQSFLAQRQDDPRMSQELTMDSEKAERILGELKLIQESSLYSLLGDPRVLADLKVDDARALELEQVLIDFRNERTETLNFGDLQYAANNASSMESMRSFIDIVRSMLTRDQIDRLRQISYQLQLPFTFNSDEVVELLELTAAQRQLINKIIADHRPDKRRNEMRGVALPNLAQNAGPPPQNAGPPPQNAGGPNEHRSPRGPEGRRGPGNSRDGFDPRGAAGFAGPGFAAPGFGFSGAGDPKMNEIRRETVEHIIRDVLNASQRQQWLELIGRPFLTP